MSTLVIDRHALAPSADPVNRAWRTFGWTPAIAGPRADRLESAVPWGSAAARSAEPARLSGRVEDVLDPRNYDRLHFAFLPLDGRLGVSVWGAIGAPEREDGEWRMLTHTLLFDRTTFRLLAGYPFGLMGRSGEPAAWFRELTERTDFAAPAAFEPIRLEPSRDLTAAFERARRAEIARLRDRLIAVAGDAGCVARNLAALYESLHRTGGAAGARHAAVRGAGPLHGELLVRLAWLSLPIDERAKVSFTTQQRRRERPVARLVVWAHDDTRDFTPGATVVVEDDALERPRGVSRGRRLWAKAVVRHGLGRNDADRDRPAADLHADEALEEAYGDPAAAAVPGGPGAAGAGATSIGAPGVGADFAHLDTRAALRGWRLIEWDDLAPVAEYADWAARWRAEGPTVSRAIELLAIETRREGASAARRLRAAGHVLGRALLREAAPAVRQPTAAVGAPDAVAPPGETGSAAPAASPIEHAAGILERMSEHVPADSAPVLRGLIRVLCRGGGEDRRAAGVLRCLAAIRASTDAVASDLPRLLDRERAALAALVADAEGAALLLHAATTIGRAGAPHARRLAAHAYEGMERADAAVDWLRGQLRLSEPGDAAWAVECLELAEQRWPQRFPDATVNARWLAPAAAAGPAAGELTRYLRHPTCMDRALHGSDPDDLAVYIDTVRPEVDELIAAFERRAASRLGPDPLGAVLTALLAAGREDDGLALARYGLDAYPPASGEAWWPEWIGGAPATWLARDDVIAVFERALRGTGAGEAAAILARLVVAGRPAGPLGVRTATLVLRLLEHERRATGRAATLDWIARELAPDRAAALLVELLSTPPPLSLFLAIRDVVIRAAAGWPPLARPSDAVAERLEAYSPAAYAALAGNRARAGRLIYLAG